VFECSGIEGLTEMKFYLSVGKTQGVGKEEL
jgi:hypothetical protein